LSLEGAYHGDTVGAVSLGHIDLFHKTYGQLLFKTDKVMSPYCYRCPFNKAKPERRDARGVLPLQSRVREPRRTEIRGAAQERKSATPRL
jgi:adenosylmethionine-8-amino-7-oxononanoate aminotransferase